MMRRDTPPGLPALALDSTRETGSAVVRSMDFVFPTKLMVFLVFLRPMESAYLVLGVLGGLFFTLLVLMSTHIAISGRFGSVPEETDDARPFSSAARGVLAQ